MALVDKLFSKLWEGAKTRSDMAGAPKGVPSHTGHMTDEPRSDAERDKLAELDARIKTLEDRLREQEF